MEDSLLMDAVERFVKNEMSPEELIYFQDLRKNNPDLDQAVVEQIFFLNEFENYNETRSFKNSLHETESRLIQNRDIQKTETAGQTKLVYLWTRYKRTVAVAASIAGVVSLFIASLISAISTDEATNIKPLVDKIHQQENKTRQIENKVNQLAAANKQILQPILDAKFRATGFLIDASKKYIVTNAHVVKEAKNQLVVENTKGQQFFAKAIYVNPVNDIAIIQVEDSSFTNLAPVPYSIRKTNADLGEQVYMLGYPKQEIVYGEGYISAKNGYLMDTIYCQLNTSANEGTSGSPVINRNGELVGIISSMERNADGVVFAIKSSNIFNAIEEVKKMDAHGQIKITSNPSLKGIDRVSQIKKVEDYVFMIKGN